MSVPPGLKCSSRVRLRASLWRASLLPLLFGLVAGMFSATVAAEVGSCKEPSGLRGDSDCVVLDEPPGWQRYEKRLTGTGIFVTVHRF